MSTKGVLNIRESLVIEVPEADFGKRLDRAVSEAMPDISRNVASSLIKNGNITIDDEIKKPGHRVKAGDLISVNIPFPTPASFDPEPIPIDLIYEDDDLIVLNKPPGLVIHPAPGHPSGTLANGLLHRFPGIFDIGGTQRPGIVHRLDKDTSGVMIVAKTSLAHERLSEKFKNREIKKIYTALVHYEMKAESGEILLPIGRHKIHRKKMSTVSRKTRRAVTLWKVRDIFHGASLLELNLKTGRTHQIRVHCAAIGHPVAGDATYGVGGKKKNINPLLELIQRQMLHAWKISFQHPRTMEPLFFQAPIPDDMNDLIGKLENQKKSDHDIFEKPNP